MRCQGLTKISLGVGLGSALSPLHHQRGEWPCVVWGVCPSLDGAELWFVPGSISFFHFYWLPTSTAAQLDPPAFTGWQRVIPRFIAAQLDLHVLSLPSAALSSTSHCIGAHGAFLPLHRGVYSTLG